MTSLPAAEDLLARASAEARLHDFGDDRFLDGLRRYLQALSDEANLNEVGLVAVPAQIHELLVNRLRFEDSLTRHPEILDEVIESPLFIVGLPRTGTTKLQHVLSRDPSVQSLPYWRILNLAPLPGTEGVRPDPRIARAQSVVDLMARTAPDFMAAHPPSAEEPEEESFIMTMTFESQSNAMFDFVPSYLAWLSTHDQHYSYTYLRRQLQYAQWQDGGGHGRPWLLKTPVHMSNLDILAEVFPDATVAHTYRDPCVVVASMLRLYEAIWTVRGNQIDPTNLDAYLQFWAEQVAIFLRQREALADKLPFVDVQYQDTVQDVASVARAVYKAWNRPLSSEAEHAMAGWDAGHPQHPYGRHTYSLERYGLTPADVQELFADYIHRFSAL